MGQFGRSGNQRSAGQLNTGTNAAAKECPVFIQRSQRGSRTEVNEHARTAVKMICGDRIANSVASQFQFQVPLGILKSLTPEY